MLKRTYDWVMQWAHSPHGTWALFLLALAESSFFPIPPDVLLMALSFSRPKRAFFYAAVSSVGSVIGGVIGYFIGYALMESIGKVVLEWYGVMDKFETISAFYNQYDGWAVAVAGFTPIPYKVFTIAAGACEISLGIFLLASILSRSARFFIVGGLIYRFGLPVRGFIEKYFNILSIVFVIILVLGFIIIKFALS